MADKNYTVKVKAEITLTKIEAPSKIEAQIEAARQIKEAVEDGCKPCEISIMSIKPFANES